MKRDEVVHQQILEAAKGLIQRYGLGKTTMEDIAKACGKGKSTLYYYFKGKDEIFDAVIRDDMQVLFSTVQQAVFDALGTEAKLKAYMVTKYQTLKKLVNLYRFTLEHESPLLNIHDQFQHLSDRYDHQEIELLTSILQGGIDDGLFDAAYQEELGMLAELCLSSIRGVELNLILKGRHGDLESKADLLVSIMVKGMA
ncbi:TetR/AcrR family transcriptional regulator [Pontibacter sp. G13]|uniref:TetR/AcrR family transcriptional regulator n=1 Tax=Pontibacter sp. G13 TaxID=3074898 RepID=UPI00288AB04B|nr:TetR/AcrR family transcriptional regulator [Pontibacter sp. G13]WNJ17428.1 TetR/AcrR family transcriptional regulator [Pontibacter sp. G13]